MMRTFSILLLSIFSIFLFPVNTYCNVYNPAASVWKLISNVDGIEMFERWINIDKDTKVRERTGKMTLRCSADEVLSLISNASRNREWMSNVEEVKVIKRSNDSDWVVHTILDVPWPFNKQDMVSNYKVTRNIVTGEIIVLVLSEKTLLPKHKDFDRLDTFNAEWVIKPCGNNKAKVTFTTKSTRPPEYPSWVQDPVVRKMFMTNLKNLKTLLTTT
ncbi:MAG: hypothetical protein JEZ09_02775 [Salinivirgaceae bacterium]|nr:hypothetical protein [Salinivirgaceae bacterium]